MVSIGEKPCKSNWQNLNLLNKIQFSIYDSVGIFSAKNDTIKAINKSWRTHQVEQ
jgi:hypothetical protein